VTHSKSFTENLIPTSFVVLWILKMSEQPEKPMNMLVVDKSN